MVLGLFLGLGLAAPTLHSGPRIQGELLAELEYLDPLVPFPLIVETAVPSSWHSLRAQFDQRVLATGAQGRGGWLAVHLSPAELRTLSDAHLRIRRPFSAQPKARAAQPSAHLVAAPQEWRQAGHDGAGIRIAVLDVGFSGLHRLPEAEQPSGLFAIPGGALSDDGLPGQPHGTAVVEVIAALAPGAEIFTIAANNELEVLQALAAIRTVEPHIINASLGFDNYWPADGSSPLSWAVTQLIETDSILWVNAAGNEHGLYLRGPVTDLDGDGVLELQGKERLGVLSNNGFVDVRLIWDEPWDNPTTDVDLFVMQANGQPCGASEEPQQDPGDHPRELYFGACPGGVALVQLMHTGGPKPKENIYFSLYSPDGWVEQPSESFELSVPADAKGALSVGACDPPGPPLQAGGAARGWSSRGPTADGRPAPTLCAQDGWETRSYPEEPFLGTSGAAPAVSAAAALAMSAHGWEYQPQLVIQYLGEQAVDQGPEGTDTAAGTGHVHLPTPPACGCQPLPTPFDTRAFLLVVLATLWPSWRLRQNAGPFGERLDPPPYPPR